jgi:hypothetical protein
MRVGPYVAATALLGLGACAGAQFNNHVFEDGDLQYRLGEPSADFQLVDIGDNDVSYADTQLGTIGVHATCEGYDDVPPQALLNQLLFGTTERRLKLEETVPLDGRGALHAVYELSLDGVPVTLDVYVLAKDGCVFDFSYVSATPAPAAGTHAFRDLVSGFSLLQSPGP